MRFRKALCVLLGLSMLLSAGCNKRTANHTETTEETYEEVTASMGETANYGNMTLTVLSAEDPDITLPDGSKALFFHVRIENNSAEQVTANYLNNFMLTVDGIEYDSDECCTIPAMQEMYNFKGIEPLNEEIPADSSCEGYVACEVAKNFSTLELHYLPKTTDRTARITVQLSAADVVKAEK